MERRHRRLGSTATRRRPKDARRGCIYTTVGPEGGGGGGVKNDEGLALGVPLECGFQSCRFNLLAHHDMGRVRRCQGGIFVRTQDGRFPPTRE